MASLNPPNKSHCNPNDVGTYQSWPTRQATGRSPSRVKVALTESSLLRFSQPWFEYDHFDPWGFLKSFPKKCQIQTAGIWTTSTNADVKMRGYLEVRANLPAKVEINEDETSWKHLTPKSSYSRNVKRFVLFCCIEQSVRGRQYKAVPI